MLTPQFHDKFYNPTYREVNEIITAQIFEVLQHQVFVGIGQQVISKISECGKTNAFTIKLLLSVFRRFIKQDAYIVVSSFGTTNNR